MFLCLFKPTHLHRAHFQLFSESANFFDGQVTPSSISTANSMDGDSEQSTIQSFHGGELDRDAFIANLLQVSFLHSLPQLISNIFVEILPLDSDTSALFHSLTEGPKARSAQEGGD